MFHEKILGDAKHITDSLMTRNVRMVPKTPELNNVVNTMLYTVMDSAQISSEMSLQERSQIMERELVSTQEGIGNGTNEIVEQLTALMKTNLLITRNYALPLIQTLCEHIEHAVSENDSRLFGDTGYIVNSYWGGGLVGTPMADVDGDGSRVTVANGFDSIMSLVREYSGATFSSPPPRPKFIEVTYKATEIYEYLKTGIAQLDDLIHEEFVNRAPEKTEAWFQSMFCVPGEGEIDVTSALEGGELLFHLLGFLFCAGVRRDNVPEGVMVNLDEYIKAIVTYKAYLGKVIFTALEKLTRQKATGYMKLNEFDLGNNKIIEVDAQILDELLSEDGPYPNISIETFIGCAMAPDPAWFKDQFIERAAEFNKIYEVSRANRLERVLTARRTLIRDTLLAKLGDVFETGDSITIEGIDGESVTLSFEQNKRSQLAYFVNDAVNEVSEGIVGSGDVVNDSILAVVSKCVCGFLLDGTMVHELVRRMMVITHAQPDVDTNHAGVVSVASILIDYMLGQVDFQLDFTHNAQIKRERGFYL